MYDVPLRTPEQAIKTAERHNRKLAQRFPLLADQLDMVGAWTPEKVLEDERRWRAKMDDSERRLREKGDVYRGHVATIMTADVLAEYDDYFRRVLPQDDGGYWADYWWRALRDLWPQQAQQMCPNAQYHAVFAKYETACRTCGRRLTPLPPDACGGESVGCESNRVAGAGEASRQTGSCKQGGNDDYLSGVWLCGRIR